jgi:hypothetical protein
MLLSGHGDQIVAGADLPDRGVDVPPLGHDADRDVPVGALRAPTTGDDEDALRIRWRGVR